MSDLPATLAAQDRAATERAVRRLDQDTLHQALTAIFSGGTDYQAGATR